MGAVTAALVGRRLIRSSVTRSGAAEQWAKGGFKAKMDRKEAIAILGLKCVALVRSSRLIGSTYRDGPTLHNNLKDAHRIMLANHPDRLKFTVMYHTALSLVITLEYYSPLSLGFTLTYPSLVSFPRIVQERTSYGIGGGK